MRSSIPVRNTRSLNRQLRIGVGVGLLAVLVGCGGKAPTEADTSAPYLSTKGGYIPEVPAPSASTNFNSQKQEEYNHFVDNPFQAVAVHPLSTFSAEVNTASYSNVRRFLNEGQKPTKDAVFLAEMVNYFPYSYPKPTGDEPVSITLDIAPCGWQPKHHLVRVGVRAWEFDHKDMPARNLVFLVDVSGSMGEDNRLPLVKKSLNMLIGTLTHRDTVSIVTYASDTSVKLPPTRGDSKARIREVVNALGSGGGTNGSAGINLAYDQARAAFIEGGVNRVIICTDGDFNLGQTSESELVRLIETQRQGRVFLSVLGFGMGNYKDSRLKALANHGNGNHAYIDSESEAHKVFVEQGASLAVVAKDVKLQVEFNPRKVSAYRLLGYENRLMRPEDFKDDAKDAAEMGAGQTVTALYEVVPVGVKIELPGVDPLKYQKPTTPVGESEEWLTAKMRYKHPDSAKSLEVVRPLPGNALGKPATADFQFAAAVAEFAMLLRDSPYKGSASYDRVISLAEANLGPDPGGHRAEFVALARKARRLEQAVREEPISKPN